MNTRVNSYLFDNGAIEFVLINALDRRDVVVVPVDRIVTSGGREFETSNGVARQIITDDLAGLVEVHSLRHVAHGAARGADRIVDHAASHLVVACKLLTVTGHPVSDADWTGNPRAGFDRNSGMLDAEDAPLLLAYPDPASSGTWHAVVEALARDMVVSVLVPWPKPPGGQLGCMRAIAVGTRKHRQDRDLLLGAISHGQRVTLFNQRSADLTRATALAQSVSATLAQSLTAGGREAWRG